jgi:hypothetical protein
MRSRSLLSYITVYAAALFSTTNAFRYVRILADLAISFHCSSDMETTVWDAFVFTQQTVNGKRIWSDRGVEWLLKDVRSWRLLKHPRPNQEALLTRLALNLVDKKK